MNRVSRCFCFNQLLRLSSSPQHHVKGFGVSHVPVLNQRCYHVYALPSSWQSTFLCNHVKSCSFDQCRYNHGLEDGSSKLILNFDTVIKPEITVEEIVEGMQGLEDNIRLRRHKLDVKQLNLDFKKFVELETEKQSLEQQRRENADLMKHFVKQKTDQVEAEKAELRKRGKLIKDKLKLLQNENYQNLSQRVLSDILRLPVELHNDSPEEDKVVEELGCKPEFSFQPLDHMKLGQNMKFISDRQTVDGTYYLSNEAALLERHLSKAVGNHLKSAGLQHFVCPDMVKAFVVEGCGFKVSEMFEVATKEAEPGNAKGSRTAGDLGKSGDHDLVLSGVSCLGFAAYFSGTNIRGNCLPIKCYSVGRNYNPVRGDETGLYSASQANSAAVFGVAASSASADAIYNEFLSTAKSLYERLSIPFRVVQVGASNLRLMESKRTDFYVWSPGFNRYIKSGELRSCGDYISRRLAIKNVQGDLKDDDNAHESNKSLVHTVDGVVIRIPSVVAALMENMQSKDGTCHLPIFTQ